MCFPLAPLLTYLLIWCTLHLKPIQAQIEWQRRMSANLYKYLPGISGIVSNVARPPDELGLQASTCQLSFAMLYVDGMHLFLNFNFCLWTGTGCARLHTDWCRHHFWKFRQVFVCSGKNLCLSCEFLSVWAEHVYLCRAILLNNRCAIEYFCGSLRAYQGMGTQPSSLPLSLSQVVHWYGELITPLPHSSSHPAS